jgi:hypothetical protein
LDKSPKRKGTTDAVEILHRLFIGDDPERQKSLEEERRIADNEYAAYWFMKRFMDRS